MCVCPCTGQDFNPVSTSLTFTSGGATSLPVVIPLVDDNVLESSEYFTALLVSSSQRVTVGQAMANVTILDDDGRCFHWSVSLRHRCRNHLGACILTTLLMLVGCTDLLRIQCTSHHVQSCM